MESICNDNEKSDCVGLDSVIVSKEIELAALR